MTGATASTAGLERFPSPVGERGYFLFTYGCQMNVADSEVLAELLDQMNYRKVDAPDRADVIVFNTCCIRENADRKLYGRLGEFKELKRQNPSLRLVVCGCLAQKDAGELVRAFPQVDVVLGTNRLGRLPAALDEVARTGAAVVDVASLKEHTIEELPSRREGSLSAWLPISFGCDNFCTFCIVPFVRGRLRSRPLPGIVAEAERLVDQGFREITLLGQNVNEYGFDLTDGSDFGSVLEALDRIPGIERIRYTTSHPKDFSLDLVDRIASLRHVCEHFHLPVQSGDDAILRRMRRGYTHAQYLRLVERIRERIPGAGITTDLIVGFPGETEAQFEMTLDLVREVRYNAAFMFAYSPREGTKAAAFEDQVPEGVRLDRLYRLIRLQNAITEERHQDEVGAVREVLVEGWSKKNPVRLTGRTRTNRIVVFDGTGAEIGQLRMVRIVRGHAWGLTGELAAVAAGVVADGG